MITEEFIKGAFSYKIEHYGKDEHEGFWHKLFCQCSSETVTTYGRDFVWGQKIQEYPCGYMVKTNRYVIKDKK